jgi:menaquinone-dependent protoporphyrinogen oxidase
MSNSILVTYASCTGSTIGVAKEIGKTLSNGGLLVDVCPMNEVNDITPYQAVVAGSAIQNKQWLPEAMDFMRIRKADLEKRPFAAFLVCMTLAMKNADQYRGFVSDFLQPVRAMVVPVSEGLFAGVLDISKVASASNRFKFRLSVKFGAWSEGDHRDWAAIRSWAESLRPLLSGN